jgi:hypothetical protein
MHEKLEIAFIAITSRYRRNPEPLIGPGTKELINVQIIVEIRVPVHCVTVLPDNCDERSIVNSKSNILWEQRLMS